MTTDEFARWKGMEIRRPDDVRTSPGGPVPIGWQAEKRTEHADRLGNLSLPADFPYDVERGDAGDALAVIALGESLRRDLGYQRAGRVRTALELGATWSEVATALDVTPAEAREVLRAWAAGQRHLYEGDVQAGLERPLGLDADRYAVMLALCELGDDETAAAVAR